MLTLYRQLCLLQLADSALPIGTLAHSFGLESLAAESLLIVAGLEDFLSDYLAEAGRLEGAFCRSAARLSANFEMEAWRDLNARLSAWKPARESRAASLALGKRFLQLAWEVAPNPMLEAARATGSAHQATAFGLAAGALEIEEELVAAAYLHQVTSNLISACQRLMPLGQRQAASILWRLKPAILAAASSTDLENVCCFTPLVELASMRHPYLATRLFVS